MTLNKTLSATNDLDTKFFINTYLLLYQGNLQIHLEQIIPISLKFIAVYLLWTTCIIISIIMYSSIRIIRSCVHRVWQGINLCRWNKGFVVWCGQCFLFLVVPCVSQLRWFLCLLGEAIVHGYLVNNVWMLPWKHFFRWN